MKITLAIIEAIIFLTLSGIHIHWLFGGKWGIHNALPSDPNGGKLFSPGIFATGMVAIGLLGFGIFYILKTGIFSITFPDWIFQYTGWVIASIFIIRAIGDFKYAGFFKQIKETDFAKYDTKLYSPLCLVIGLIGIILESKCISV
jgi:hypothetical protein